MPLDRRRLLMSALGAIAFPGARLALAQSPSPAPAAEPVPTAAARGIGQPALRLDANGLPHASLTVDAVYADWPTTLATPTVNAARRVLAIDVTIRSLGDAPVVIRPGDFTFLSAWGFPAVPSIARDLPAPTHQVPHATTEPVAPGELRSFSLLIDAAPDQHDGRLHWTGGLANGFVSVDLFDAFGATDASEPRAFSRPGERSATGVTRDGIPWIEFTAISLEPWDRSATVPAFTNPEFRVLTMSVTNIGNNTWHLDPREFAVRTTSGAMALAMGIDPDAGQRQDDRKRDVAAGETIEIEQIVVQETGWQPLEVYFTQRQVQWAVGYMAIDLTWLNAT